MKKNAAQTARTTTATHRVQSLADLKKIAAQLNAQRAAQALREQQLRQQQARQEAERNLFARAVGRVTALPSDNRVRHDRPGVEPAPRQFQLDEARALQESISDDFDVSSLLETDDSLSYRQKGVAADVLTRLRRGHWSIQASLDLHGLRLDDAREAVGAFIREHFRNGIRCVRIIHGKGHGSPGRVPILKSRVQRWLVQKSEVIAFVQAKPSEGGAGALIILLDRAPARTAANAMR